MNLGNTFMTDAVMAFLETLFFIGLIVVGVVFFVRVFLQEDKRIG